MRVIILLYIETTTTGNVTIKNKKYTHRRHFKAFSKHTNLSSE
jgi:hypothetical protein